MRIFMNKYKTHKLTLLAISIAAGIAAPASAAVITQTLGATSAASAGGLNATPTVNTQIGYTSSYSSLSNTSGSANSSAFSNQNGAYAVQSSSSGLGRGEGNATLRYSFLNNSAAAQDLSLTFKIYGGGISTSLVTGQTLTGSQNLSTSYAASIEVGGVSKFSSAASIVQTATGFTSSKTGVDLSAGSDDGSDGVYNWNSQFVTLQLGSVAAGAAIDVVAMLQQSSLSDSGTYTYDCGVDGYGGYQTFRSDAVVALASAAGVTTCTGFKGNARGFYGDPTTLDASTASGSPAFAFSFAPTSSSVPVPGSLALGVLGLGALLASRRKQVRK
jgi:uncharacterized protein (TIGR03382 family)